MECVFQWECGWGGSVWGYAQVGEDVYEGWRRCERVRVVGCGSSERSDDREGPRAICLNVFYSVDLGVDERERFEISIGKMEETFFFFFSTILTPLNVTTPNIR